MKQASERIIACCAEWFTSTHFKYIINIYMYICIIELNNCEFYKSDKLLHFDNVIHIITEYKQMYCPPMNAESSNDVNAFVVQSSYNRVILRRVNVFLWFTVARPTVSSPERDLTNQVDSIYMILFAFIPKYLFDDI